MNGSETFTADHLILVRVACPDQIERRLDDAVLGSSRDERGCSEIACRVQHRGEDVGDRIDGDQDPDPFGGQTDREKERREHDERAARDAWHGERQEHRSERDRRELPAWSGTP